MGNKIRILILEKEKGHWSSLHEVTCAWLSCGYAWTDMPIVLLGGGVKRTPCLPIWCILWKKREIPLPLQTQLWPETQDHGVPRPIVLGIVHARTHETQREVVERQQYNHKAHQQRKITTSFRPSTPAMLQVNKGLHNWAPH